MSGKIGIIDYGSGNFTSVYNSVNAITSSVKAIKSSADFSDCSHIILPGVGAYAASMEKIKALNLTDSLNDEVLLKKKAFLGICVGFQVMADYGYEFGKADGLGWLQGDVIKFNFEGHSNLSLPHIGWNDIEEFEDKRLFKDINPGEPSFYFVHSYHLSSSSETTKFSYCSYGYRFVAAAENENIFGVQFHPEKSQRNGLQVLKNFITIND